MLNGKGAKLPWLRSPPNILQRHRSPPGLKTAVSPLFSVSAAVATLSFETPAQYILPPIVYFLLTALEGSFVTPIVVGRRLTLNPVVILMGLFLWGWIWGIPGAVLAVPMLASFKIVCDHLPPMAPIGEFLGGDGTHDERTGSS